MHNQITTASKSSIIEGILKNSARIFLDNIIVCIANTVIAFLATVILLFTVVGILAIPAVWGGYTESMIRLSIGKQVEIGDFFRVGINQWSNLLIGCILYIICVSIGLILFIVPGIYILVRWYFIYQIIVYEYLDPIEAIKKSSKMTSSIIWEVLALLIICAIIGGIGGLVPFLTVVTTPFVSIVSAKYFITKLNHANHSSA